MKTLLKKILPRVVLSNWHTQYNKLRINTIDKLFFPEEKIQNEAYIIKRDAHPFDGVNFQLAELNPIIQAQIKIWQKWTQDEYLLIYNAPCLIEPSNGWALSARNKLVYPSLGFSRVSYLPKPPIKALWMHKRKVVEYEELISLRDTGEENYYHFYNDVLGKLFFLEEQLQISNQIPVLIAKKLFDKPYFKYFLEHPFLKNRIWVIQDKQYIKSNKTFFCKPLTHTIQYYELIRQMARFNDLLSQRKARCLFIARSPKRLRFIENNAAIAAICQQQGFEVIDFDTMTLSAQIQVVSEARYIVAIHGAGLVNMLFRGSQPLTILELFPPGEYYPFHYMLMAAQLGYTYQALIGTTGSKPYGGGFYVEPAEFKKLLNQL